MRYYNTCHHIMPRHTIMDIRDIATRIAEYAGDREFLPFSNTCKMFRDIWGTRPKITLPVDTYTTTASLHEFFDTGLRPRSSLINRAVKMRRMDLMDVASSRGCIVSDKTFSTTASRGYMDGLIWAMKKGNIEFPREKNTRLRKIALNSAAYGGHIDIVKYLIDQGVTVDHNTCYHASRGGKLEILRYLRKINCPWDKMTCNAAASNGHLDVLKWAHENSCKSDYHLFRYAAFGGNVGVIRYVIEIYPNYNMLGHDLCTATASGGHIDALDFYKQRGLLWSSDTCRNAIAHNHVKVLGWGIQNQQMVSRDPSIMAWASVNNDVDTMDWLMDNGFQYDYMLCKMAAMKGSLKVLEWAWSKGIQFDQETWCGGILGKKQYILDYLREKGCPGSFS